MSKYDRWATMDETEMRETPAPWPESAEDLADLARVLVEREHEYGTCVYAMSVLAVSSINFAARRLGVTGFQVSQVDLDVIRRTRNIDRFRIQNLSDRFADPGGGVMSVKIEKIRHRLADWIGGGRFYVCADSADRVVGVVGLDVHMTRSVKSCPISTRRVRSEGTIAPIRAEFLAVMKRCGQ